jgi:hypothetical protein
MMIWVLSYGNFRERIDGCNIWEGEKGSARWADPKPRFCRAYGLSVDAPVSQPGSIKLWNKTFQASDPLKL